MENKNMEVEVKAEEMENVEIPAITKKDVNKLFFRWYVRAEMSNSFERLQSLSFCSAMVPALRKLYPDKEKRAEALQRNLQFFNTEGIFGAAIHGTTLAMEEQKARGENIPDEMITNIKTGLMGPMAGIGDTLTWGILRPILLALAASFAMQGSALGIIFPFIFVIVTYIIGNYLCNMGYTMGRNSIKEMLSGGKIKDVIYAAGIIGVFMMGALAASYVDISTPLSFSINGEEMVVQDMLDSIIKGLLPLGFVMGSYFFLKKFPYKILPLLLIIVAVCLLGSLFGVL